MNTKTLSASSKRELIALDAQLGSFRTKFGISAPGTILYSSSLSSSDDETLLVEADGFGGATMHVVEGNYPFDYLTQFAQFFEAEIAAVAAAEEYLATQC